MAGITLMFHALCRTFIVNASEASVQTEGIAVEAGKAVWITVADDATASVSYEAQSMAEVPEYVEKFTVHAYVPLTWKSVNLWAWSAPDGTNAFAAWPVRLWMRVKTAGSPPKPLHG